MERELLFWSLTLMAFYLVFDRADLGMKLMAKSILPLSMNVWWYATAYAIFLALLPFLSKGLKALGRECHLALAVIVLVIWGLTSFIPKTLGDSALTGVFGFIYLFILISAYKWYMKPFSVKQACLMISIGLGFFLLYTCASIALSLLGHNVNIYITGDWRLPVIMVGFGMFLLFDCVTFHSRIVNRIAKSAFAVYLITDYAASENYFGPLGQPSEPIPAASRNPADLRHPVDNLRGLHPARLYPSGTIRCHRRQATWTLVRPAVEQDT